MLGTILGVSSVIAMLAIGEGSKRKAVEQIANCAANVIVRSVKPGKTTVAMLGRQQQPAVSRVAEYGLNTRFRRCRRRCRPSSVPCPWR
jgi:ABC-type antimicrobial peptide transport system permease subunit